MKGIILCDNGKLLDTAKLCKEHNCGIEIQSYHMPDYLSENPDSIDLHLKETEDIKIRSLHGPFGDLCPGSYDELIREVTKKRYEYAYDISIKLGVTDIVLHHGYVPKTSRYENWVKRASSFWKEFIADKSANIRFHLENMLELDPNLLSDVVAEIGSENVDVCLDIGHAHCNSKSTVVEWIRYLNNQIGYVHLHDNHGEYDEHLGLGEGTIPLLEVLKALEEYTPDAYWAIETDQGNMVKSLKYILDKGW